MNRISGKINDAKQYVRNRTNGFVVVCFFIAIATIVMYFFPFFTFKDNSETTGATYNYSGFDMTVAMISGEKYADPTDFDYQRRQNLVNWITNEQTHEYFLPSVICASLGVAFMIIAFLFLFTRDIGLPEIIFGLGSAISFGCCYVFNKFLVNELTHADYVADGIYRSGWGLWISIICATIFFSLCIVRYHRRKKKGR